MEDGKLIQGWVSGVRGEETVLVYIIDDGSVWLRTESGCVSTLSAPS